MPLHLRRRSLFACLAALGLSACGRGGAKPLRFGAHPWPGYQLLYLARDQGYLPAAVQLVETPSSSASLRSLANGTLDGAALTLDEVITARSRGLNLRVVAVVDVSLGADVVLAREGITRPQQLRGRRVGVEPSATAAVMLDAFLRVNGMDLTELKLVELTVDEHVAAYRSHRVDAVVTYAPASNLLRRDGAVQLFSSAQVPGRIVDVLAVQADRLDACAQGIRALVHGHFTALAAWRADPSPALAAMAQSLHIEPAELAAVLKELELPDAAANHSWLATDVGRLNESARMLSRVMRSAGLLPEQVDGPDLSLLVDDHFLPAT
ncbi:ABC transporter substrate-binding protein [Ideonella margarita]|uniref:ABC transporter substrate-binding protein n=1 Tax=Ideonella margarita TaxID=2984191 RepID=A0ABU9BZ73_9BURK